MGLIGLPATKPGELALVEATPGLHEVAFHGGVREGGWLSSSRSAIANALVNMVCVGHRHPRSARSRLALN
jgi:hypothetical protein